MGKVESNRLSSQRGKNPFDTVVIVGGCGGMSSRYREVVEGCGLQLRHFEKRVPAGSRRQLGHVAVIIVVISMVSHALSKQVRDVIGDETQVVYLKSASISAVKAAVLDVVSPDGNQRDETNAQAKPLSQGRRGDSFGTTA